MTHKSIAVFFILLPFAVYSQQMADSTQHHKKTEHKTIGVGIKAGFNFANITNASQINTSSRVGFQVGVLFEPASRSVLRSRTELVYSQHGYNYAADTASGSVALDYIMLAQYLAIHITKYFEIMVGAQTGYLLSVKMDSSGHSTGNASIDQAISYYNRFDFGYGGGAEVHPIAGLLIGARYNVSLTNLYKQPSSYVNGGMATPIALPSINWKSNLVQLYLGYRF